MVAMLERIEHPELPVRDVTVPTTLVVRRSCGAMIRRSVRPGHSRDSDTEPPLARANAFRAKRLRISVEMRLR